ncbi:hypothetical protein KJ877_08395 [bacterium]|nr:hypothetical protein [bacterium]MBU1990235.1 hypothetical protein [bacterium]
MFFTNVNMCIAQKFPHAKLTKGIVNGFKGGSEAYIQANKDVATQKAGEMQASADGMRIAGTLNEKGNLTTEAKDSMRLKEITGNAEMLSKGEFLGEENKGTIQQAMAKMINAGNTKEERKANVAAMKKDGFIANDENIQYNDEGKAIASSITPSDSNTLAKAIGTSQGHKMGESLKAMIVNGYEMKNAGKNLNAKADNSVADLDGHLKRTDNSEILNDATSISTGIQLQGTTLDGAAWAEVSAKIGGDHGKEAIIGAIADVKNGNFDNFRKMARSSFGNKDGDAITNEVEARWEKDPNSESDRLGELLFVGATTYGAYKFDKKFNPETEIVEKKDKQGNTVFGEDGKPITEEKKTGRGVFFGKALDKGKTLRKLILGNASTIKTQQATNKTYYGETDEPKKQQSENAHHKELLKSDENIVPEKGAQSNSPKAQLEHAQDGIKKTMTTPLADLGQEKLGMALADKYASTAPNTPERTAVSQALLDLQDGKEIKSAQIRAAFTPRELNENGILMSKNAKGKDVVNFEAMGSNEREHRVGEFKKDAEVAQGKIEENQKRTQQMNSSSQKPDAQTAQKNVAAAESDSKTMHDKALEGAQEKMKNANAPFAKPSVEASGTVLDASGTVLDAPETPDTDKRRGSGGLKGLIVSLGLMAATGASADDIKQSLQNDANEFTGNIKNGNYSNAAANAIGFVLGKDTGNDIVAAGMELSKGNVTNAVGTGLRAVGNFGEDIVNLGGAISNNLLGTNFKEMDVVKNAGTEYMEGVKKSNNEQQATQSEAASAVQSKTEAAMPNPSDIKPLSEAKSTSETSTAMNTNTSSPAKNVYICFLQTQRCVFLKNFHMPS